MGHGKKLPAIWTSLPPNTEVEQPEENDHDKIFNHQGGPMGMNEAMAGANPHYMESVNNQLNGHAEDVRYTHNCQRCVWAVEMRARGYDVEAMPRTADDDYASSDPKKARSWVNVAQGGLKMQDMNNYYDTGYFHERPSATDIKKNILQNVMGGQDGRAILEMTWNLRYTKAGWTSKGGHVLNVEVKNGKIKLYDGQTGRTTSLTKLVKNGANYFRCGRTDNVKINEDLITDFVKSRR